MKPKAMICLWLMLLGWLATGPVGAADKPPVGAGLELFKQDAMTFTNYNARFQRFTNSLDVVRKDMEARLPQPRMFVLQFDKRGQLMNQHILLDLIRHVGGSLNTPGQRPLTNVVVASLGWNHDHHDFEAEYHSLLHDYLRYLTHTTNASQDLTSGRSMLRNAVFVGVSWDSTYSGVSEAINEVVPTESAGEILSKLVDLPLFPLSVWAKSTLADRIAMGDLKFSLQALHDAVNQSQHPLRYHYLGHSFGCRIVSGLFGTRLEDNREMVRREIHGSTAAPFKWDLMAIKFEDTRQGDSFTFRRNTASMVLMLPAMTVNNLPDAQKYRFPLFVIQSRHDHINGTFFPIANLPFNTYVGSSSEAVQRHLYDAEDGSLWRSNTNRFSQWLWNRTLRKGCEFLFDLGTPIVSVAASGVRIPISYWKGQRAELTDPNHSLLYYIPDTLAQIPIVKLPVQLLDPTGKVGQHKGLLNFGPEHESVARMAWTTNGGALTNVIARLRHPAGERFAPGIYYVQSETASRHSMAGNWLDFQNRAKDHSIGWLDPVGSHADFRPNSEEARPPPRKQVGNYRKEQRANEESRRKFVNLENNIFDLVHEVLNHDVKFPPVAIATSP